ncbi:MAG: ABC transporter substrate-binding protein, partial [Planctomycetota bacterium]
MFTLDATKIGILVALAIVLGVPFIFEPEEAKPDPNALRLIIVTPHNEQIRYEFETAFDRWHREQFNGQGVDIDWRTPGGTTEIRRQLFAEYAAAARRDTMDQMSYDLLFGGGSYEHGQIAREQTVTDDTGEEITYTVSEPVTDFTDEQLEGWYGENRIGRNTLYDPNRQWFGAALSAFGIVYNRDALNDLGAAEPKTWADLTNPKMFGWVALADPGQSGSICTTFEVILQLQGWDRGWEILQEAAANSRYFANSSSKIPIDVSLGEAAAGMCIDFYGRTQSEAIAKGGDEDRLGYVDPAGLTDIDPDPISLLRGAPNRELAVRFIEFTLSEEGQALWQFPVVQAEMQAAPSGTGETSSVGGNEIAPSLAGDAPRGPSRFTLRRMPIRRVMYDKYFDQFSDQVNPFELARPIDSWDYSVRRYIPPIFSAMAIDNHATLQRAWQAMVTAGPEHPRYAEMQRLFNEIPGIPLVPEDLGWLLPDARRLLGDSRLAAAFDEVRESAGSSMTDQVRQDLETAARALRGEGGSDTAANDAIARLASDEAFMIDPILDAFAESALGGEPVLQLDTTLGRNITQTRWRSDETIKDR